MLDQPVLTRIREYVAAELRPRDRPFANELQTEQRRLTPSQGAMSGAMAHVCMELGKGELQVRAGIIWEAIKRSHASLVGRDSPAIVDDLQQQIAEYLTEEARTVAE